MDPHLLKYDEEGKIYFTYDQIVQMPEFPQSPILELFDGELFLSPSPTFIHQEISSNLNLILSNFIRKHKLGKLYYAPADVKLSNTNLVVPDLFFIEKSRLDIIKDQKYAEGAPDLIIEILSSNRNADLVTKMELYQRFGVREYWIVDPKNESLTILSLKKDKYEKSELNKEDDLKSKVLMSLQFMVSEIFNFEI